jgi:hypothetical protein
MVFAAVMGITFFCRRCRPAAGLSGQMFGAANMAMLFIVMLAHQIGAAFFAERS